jgi:hypothetical protein
MQTDEDSTGWGWGQWQKKGIEATGYFFRYRREVGDIELRGKL